MIIPALRKTYNGKTVLDFPETEIRDGSITAICGHNGSGKSTLGKILAGIIKEDSSKTLSSKLKVGYMSQSSLPFRMSVKRNLLLNSDKELSKKEKLERAEKLINDIGLEEFASANAAKMSGGQTERMALARILMRTYDLLILDEPTASMDREAIPAAEKMIIEYRDRTGSTIILITHSAEQADRLADTVINLRDGQIE